MSTSPFRRKATLRRLLFPSGRPAGNYESPQLLWLLLPNLEAMTRDAWKEVISERQAWSSNFGGWVTGQRGLEQMKSWHRGR